jgi:hypothetical protein
MQDQPIIKYGLIGIGLAAIVAISFHLTGTPISLLKDTLMVAVAVLTTIGARSQVFTKASTEKLVTAALDEIPPANSERRAAEIVEGAKATKEEVIK